MRKVLPRAGAGAPRRAAAPTVGSADDPEARSPTEATDLLLRRDKHHHSATDAPAKRGKRDRRRFGATAEILTRVFPATRATQVSTRSGVETCSRNLQVSQFDRRRGLRVSRIHESAVLYAGGSDERQADNLAGLENGDFRAGCGGAPHPLDSFARRRACRHFISPWRPALSPAVGPDAPRLDQAHYAVALLL